jgi:hypothetical protein
VSDKDHFDTIRNMNVSLSFYSGKAVDRVIIVQSYGSRKDLADFFSFFSVRFCCSETL